MKVLNQSSGDRSSTSEFFNLNCNQQAESAIDRSRFLNNLPVT
jgi:hypothetical protein